MGLRSNATEQDHASASVVRDSALFDAGFYTAHVDDAEARADPALHYVMVGEPSGAAASERFSAEVYVSLNPDLVNAPTNRLLHYEVHGRSEGRAFRFATDELALEVGRLDAGKPTVILLLHEATYSGAPILGRSVAAELKLTNNVVVVLRQGGALEPALLACSNAIVGPLPPAVRHDPAEMANLAARLRRAYAPAYAIANSVETRLLGMALRKCGTPLVALVHEFASHAQPYALKDFYEACDALVFPAELVRRSSVRAYPVIAQRRTYILPQGAVDIPRLDPAVHAAGPSRDHQPEGVSDLQRALSEPSPPFTVVGLGSVDLRKGVDLFVAAATALKARHPELAFRFIWIGERVHPLPHAYYTFLDEQVERSGLGDRLVLAGALDDLEPVYAAADALFLSSRLDPLPNVAIDAARHGLPILCFHDATGFSDILQEDPATAWLVAPYMDTAAVAEAIARLATEPGAREDASSSIRRMARRRFNMIRYVSSLEAIGQAAAERRATYFDQAAVLMADDAFDAGLYFGDGPSATATRSAAVERYLEETLNVDFTGAAAWGHHPRRALPGFHALLYGDAAPGFGRDAVADPVAHFVAGGRAAGPWSHEVIRLDRPPGPSGGAGAAPLRAAMHGHFHYTDNFPDFLEALAANRRPIDLFLTTTTDAAAAVLERQARGYARGRVCIEVEGRNIGRDIAPFVRLLQGELAGYDVVGHLHGKRSIHTLHYDADLGNRWRVFLWQHLLGPAAPVADILIERFAGDPRLGLVFPENDFLVGWELNLEQAEALAPRLKLDRLPRHLEFPVGTMFWCRPAALRRLAEAGFEAADYPPEPLPIDGTMLHALERLLTVVTEAEGFRYATTYFPRFRR